MTTIILIIVNKCYLVVGPYEDSIFHLSMSICVVLIQVLFSQPCCCGIMAEASLSFLRDIISQQISGSSGSFPLSYHTPSKMLPEPLRLGTSRSVLSFIMTNLILLQ